MHDQIAQHCYQAIALIEKDGWTMGGGGWTNENGQGWCLEGALGNVIGVPCLVNIGTLPTGVPLWTRNAALGTHPTMVAVEAYLAEREGRRTMLYNWNDRHSQEDVVRLLREVAAKHTMQPPVLEPSTLDKVVVKAMSEPNNPTVTVVPEPVFTEVVPAQVAEVEKELVLTP